jgi:hypothetical protein
MGAACRNARHDPFPFGNLLFDRQMEIWVGIADAKNVLLRPFEPDCMPDVIVDLYIGWEMNSANRSTLPVLTTSS